VHFPVLALLPRRQQGLGCAEGIVPVVIGVVDNDKTDLSLEFFQEILDGRTGRLAVRSLKVEKLDDGYGSILRTQVGPVGNINADPLFRSRGRQCHESRQQSGENDVSSHEYLLMQV
jgi:hypothetical protein